MRLSSTQRRFFAIYILFFLCMLLLLVPLFNITMDELERNAVSTSKEVLSGGLTRLEDEMRLIFLAGTTLFQNQQVASMAYTKIPLSVQDAYRARQALQDMDDIRAMLEMTDDFGIVFKEGIILANGRMHLSASDFYPKYVDDGVSESLEAWLKRLYRPEEDLSFTPMRVIAYPRAARDVVAVAMTLPYGTAWNRSVMFALIDHSRILSMLALPETLAHAALTVTDSDGQTLVSHDAGGVHNAVRIEQRSADYGLSVTLSIDRSLFAAKLTGFRNLLLAALAAYVLLGVALSAIFSWRNAKPVLGMLEAAQAAGQEAGGRLKDLNPVAFASGYHYMRAFLGEVGEKLRDNQLLLAAQEQALRENLFERLIRGDVYYPGTLMTAERYLPDYPESCRMALLRLQDVYELSPDDFSKIQLTLLDIVARVLPPEAGGHIHFTSNLLVLVLPVPPADDRARVEAWLAQLGEAILKETGISIHTAVSAPFSGMASLSEAFRRLRQLLRSMEGSPNGQCRFWEDVPARAHPSVARNASRFYEVLVRGEVALALALLGEDVEELRGNESLTEADLQQGFYLYRHALAQAREEWESPLPPLPEYRSSLNLDELFRGVIAWAEAFGLAYEARRASMGEQVEREVIRMIDENLDNPDLYIRLVTEHFQISEAHLQRIMRKATGCSFFEYVDQRRMSLARQLLTQTRLPITQILQQCGYSTTNTFYKAFKRCYGVSPTALRAQETAQAKG